MRVLVAIEPRAYREAIAGAIQALRPNLKVVVVEPDQLEDVVLRLDPELVLSSQPSTAVPESRSAAWVEYRPYEQPAAKIDIYGCRWELEEVELEDLLAVVDDAGRLALAKNDLRRG